MHTDDTDPGSDVRQHLLTASHGTLCTISTKAQVMGFPFGSIVPFALTADGMPLILIANIAAHTRNLTADPRASLFVHQPPTTGDPQAGWRITLMGRFLPAAEGSWQEHHARYLERVPAAEGYLRTHGFSYYTMPSYDKIRYIGGFGKIQWIDGRHGRRDPHGAGLQQAAAGAIAHMNADHADALVDMCHGLYGFKPDQATMTAIDRAGMMVRVHHQANERLLYFPFHKEISAASLRHDVVDLLKRARSKIQPS